MMTVVADEAEEKALRYRTIINAVFALASLLCAFSLVERRALTTV